MGLLRMRRPPIAALGGGIAASAILTLTTTEAAPDEFDPVITTTSGTGKWLASDGQTITSNSPTFTFAAGTKTVLLTDIEASAITQLLADADNLTGSIPTEIGALTNLTLLWLQSNQLSGSIPTEIGALTNLTLLLLQSNQLSGSIPTEIGALTNLTRLQLYLNQLSGSIPTGIGALSNLTQLLLYNNQLTGVEANATNGLDAIQLFQAQNNLLTQAAVDEVLRGFWVNADAGNQSFATPSGRVDGVGNATPSGVYADPAPADPSTGLEYAWVLVNTYGWSWMWEGGSAP